jgi:hypothetical protein
MYLGAQTVIGDAITVTGHARGGDDVVSAVPEGRANAFSSGDAVTLSSHAQGGNDTVTVSGFYVAAAYGDAFEMIGHAKGGDDFVTERGTLANVAQLYGDAQTLSGSAIGGDDTLIATSENTTQMYGDGAELLNRSKGGDDTLVSGIGDDHMWGDAAVVARRAKTGGDTFVFSTNNGYDIINDFQNTKDHIQLEGFGFESFNDVASHIQYTADGALITFDASDTILVVGINQLTATDFILA